MTTWLGPLSIVICMLNYYQGVWLSEFWDRELYSIGGNKIEEAFLTEQPRSDSLVDMSELYGG